MATTTATGGTTNVGGADTYGGGSSPGPVAPAPSTPSANSPAGITIPQPSNAAEWAIAILIALGIKPNNNNVFALVAQMHVEDPTLKYLTSKNNPLAVTNVAASGTPIPGNSAGVMAYGNWLDGLESTVVDIKANPAMLAALQKGSPCSSYAMSVAQSIWEGQGGNNAGYGSSVGSACKSLAGTSGPQFTPSSVYDAIVTAYNSQPGIAVGWGAPGGGVVSDIANALTAPLAWTEELGTLLGKLIDPAFWLRVGTGALGLALVVVGLGMFLSTTETGQKAETAAGDLGAAALVA